MFSINDLKFDENGLIPAVVTDFATGNVLMHAYMNEKSLKTSIDEGRTCFWSRSRKKLWRKGETSGNIQHIISIKTDCDRDTLLVTVRQTGPACHTGAESCFFEDVYGEPAKVFSSAALYNIIDDRKKNGKPGSYTAYLFDKGIDKILKKIGEESTEVIIAGKAGDKAETIYELADLVYHAMVLMVEIGIRPEDIQNELAKRHAGDKSKQENMT